jgi:hypothetical protein
MVDTSLKYAATVSMSCYLDTVGSDSIVDELYIFISTTIRKYRTQTNLVVLGHKLVQTFLNNMVAVEILDKDYYV